MQTKFLPTFCYPGRSRPIKGMVVHFISGIYMEPSNPWDMQVCWNILHDLNLPKSGRKFYPDCGEKMGASYNELIGRQAGEDWLLVPYGKLTYHAGVSLHKGVSGCNDFMVGVALVGTEESGYTDWQYECLANIAATLMQTHKFELDDIVGHDTVRHNAKLAGMTDSKGKPPKDKLDPSGQADGKGSNFDWMRFRRMVADASRELGAGG